MAIFTIITMNYDNYDCIKTQQTDCREKLKYPIFTHMKIETLFLSRDGIFKNALLKMNVQAKSNYTQ